MASFAFVADFFAGTTRDPEWRSENNVMGEAPILVDGDFTLSQSGAIQQWVVDKSGKLGGKPQDKYEVLRWVLFDNHKMSSQTGITRFLMNFLPEKNRNPDVIAFMQGRCKAAFDVLNTHLTDRDWIVGDEITIADIANCGYLYYPEPFGFEREDWPNIDRWLSNISNTPGWKAPYDLMPGSPADRV